MAVADGCVLALGTEEEVEALAGPRTQRVSVGGAAVLPGFVDAHIHLLSGGLDLSRVDLRSVSDPESFRERVAAAAATQPAGTWILGGGWDEHRWGGALPHREWLDAVAPDHPVFLTRSDLHVGVANTQALERGGLLAEAAGAEFSADVDGGAGSGLLREAAMDPVTRLIPSPTEAQRETAIQAAVVEALRHGVTQVHDMGVLQNAPESWASLAALERLRNRGALGMRVSAAVPLSERAGLHARIREHGRGCDRLQWGAVKAFVDGSLGAATAWFLDDYAHQPGHRGAPVVDLDELAAALDDAVRLDLDPVVHAIGDAATAWLAAQYAGLLATHGPRVRQLRMEHAQHLTPGLMSQLVHPSLILSMQPGHLLDDGPWMRGHLGDARMRGAYAFRTLLEAGARLAFGSDWTVAPMDPRVALEGAVRADHPGGPEGIPVEAAILAHTWGASEAAGFRGETGALLPGRRADFTVWDRSPMDLPAGSAFTEIQIESTWVDGVLAWSQ
jgi:predicted amidohydrolase YtcJ